MLEEFKRRAIKLLDVSPRNDFEWMFIAQHHGLPTRLLDWSTNPFVALFFALSGNKSAKEYEEGLKDYYFGDIPSNEKLCNLYLEEEYSEFGAAVFVIDPYEINKCCAGDMKNRVPPINVADNYEKWRHYVNPMQDDQGAADLPICVYSSDVDVRISVQNGHFTLHGSITYPLEYYVPLRPLIYKIFIPYYRIDEIKNDLYTFGMSESVLFPGLDSLTKEIKKNEEMYFEREKVEGI